MPSKTMATCRSRRGNDPKRLTLRSPPVPPYAWPTAGWVPGRHGGARPAPGTRRPGSALVPAHRQRLQGQVVVAERGHVEPVHPVPDAVAVGAVVGDDERRLLVDDLLDLVIHVLALAVVQLGSGLVDEAAGLRVAPVAVEGVGAALAVRAERGDLIGVDDV